MCIYPRGSFPLLFLSTTIFDFASVVTMHLFVKRIEMDSMKINESDVLIHLANAPNIK